MSGGIGVGVVGLGFMGRTHIKGFRAANELGSRNRLRAVCDQDPERLTGKAARDGNYDEEAEGTQVFDPTEVEGYTEPGLLIADPNVDLVSICTHTSTHVDLAIQALEAGKHVLVEKPVALSSVELERLARAARSARTLCMPAMCVRFWPGWDWLRARIRDGSYGAVSSATFTRLGTCPDWAPGFYDDREASGGAIFDLHIHDVDFVRHCFGEPDGLTAVGTVDHVTTAYRFEGGPAHVVAEGGWDQTPGFPFRMRYRVAFETATAEFDLSRTPPLMVARGGEWEPVELDEGDGYVGEIRHLLDAIERGATEISPSVEDALAVTRLLEAERAGLQLGGWRPAWT